MAEHSYAVDINGVGKRFLRHFGPALAVGDIEPDEQRLCPPPLLEPALRLGAVDL